MRYLFFLFALLAAPAFAQGAAPQGIGFAQAEEGTWLCRHDTPEEALSCARELCIEQASGQECWQTAWCLPANWSGLMTIWLADFHTTHVLCGAPSEASLTAALAAICAGDEGATRCDITLLIDPSGNELESQLSFPGPAAPPPLEPAAGAEPQEGEPQADGGAASLGGNGAQAPVTDAEPEPAAPAGG